MVTYDEIFKVFCRYAVSRDQSDWCDLWILCTRRMEALVKIKAKALKVPLSSEDIADLITDSTALVMKKLREGNDIDSIFVSKAFWNSYRTSLTLLIRSRQKIIRDRQIIRELNQNFFLK